MNSPSSSSLATLLAFSSLDFFGFACSTPACEGMLPDGGGMDGGGMAGGEAVTHRYSKLNAATMSAGAWVVMGS